MTATITYSNDKGAAFIATIVRSFQERHPQSYLGRTAIQKLTYFCSKLGVPVPFRFEIYTYGPYSDSVTFTIESLLADDVLVDKSLERKYSRYDLGLLGNEFLDQNAGVARDYLPIIDTVVETFGSFGPAELELIATLHFVAQRQRAITKTVPNRESVVGEFTQIKGDKFSSESVNAWFDALTKSKLI